MTVKYKSCGITETKTERTELFTGKILLQFDENLATAKDITYNVRCIREGGSPIFQIIPENFTLSRPPCRYSVRPIGKCSSIAVGDALLHSWQCDYEDVKMSIQSCYLVEPFTHKTFPILDSESCEISPYISAFTQTATSTFTARGEAVRFSASPLVYFRCSIRLCRGENCQKQTCRKKREIEAGKEIRFAENEEYEYNDEFPSIEERREEATSERPTTGRAILNPLTAHRDTIGTDILLASQRLVLTEGQKKAAEINEFSKERTAHSESAPALIVFGKSGDFQRITPRTTLKIKSTTAAFPTLLTESTTINPTTVEAVIPLDIEMILESDPLLIRLPYESFSTACNKNN